MKQTMFAIITLLTLISVPGRADGPGPKDGDQPADGITTHYQCFPACSACRGHLVNVISGGYIGILRADIYSQSFLGKKHLATYGLKDESHLETAYFVDSETRGSQFKLLVHTNGSAHLETVIDGRDVIEELYCSPPEK